MATKRTKRAPTGKQATSKRTKAARARTESVVPGAPEAPPGGWGGKNPPPPHTRFKPGQSGNPSGRPQGTSLTARLRKALNADGGRLADEVVRKLVSEAKRGKFNHVKEIFDRVDGSVVQRFKVDDALQDMLKTAERVLERDQYAKLVFALAGHGEEGSREAPAEAQPVH